jgi:hypothetical protein
MSKVRAASMKEMARKLVWPCSVEFEG